MRNRWSSATHFGPNLGFFYLLVGGPRSQILGLLDPSTFFRSLVKYSDKIHSLCTPPPEIDWIWMECSIKEPKKTFWDSEPQINVSYEKKYETHVPLPGGWKAQTR